MIVGHLFVLNINKSMENCKADGTRTEKKYLPLKVERLKKTCCAFKNIPKSALHAAGNIKEVK